MPKGILFDHAGEMTQVIIASDTVMSQLYEHIGCRVVIPLSIADGINLWVDAEGADNGQSLNVELTWLADTVGNLDTPIYGPGVFLGCDESGPTAPIRNLTPDDRLAIVLAHVRHARTRRENSGN